jgi:hypothetical protein
LSSCEFGRPVLVLLEAACTERTREELEALAIGERDARLLELRELTFGPQITGIATCPSCNERLELQFTAAEIRVKRKNRGGGVQGEPRDTLNNPSDGKKSPILSLEEGGYYVSFRLPTSRDLATADLGLKHKEFRTHLLSACIVSALKEGHAIRADELPEEILKSVIQMMESADPQAAVWLDLTCAACGRHWDSTLFDVVSFFWAEIDAWAWRTLVEVHTLASAYGWTEAEILAMSPWKRQRYLEILGDDGRD